ncbi:MAG: alginate O-acetyltransferase AlgF, partial [Alkalispirochaeta sp.]
MTTVPFRLAIAIIGFAVGTAAAFGQDGLYAPSVPEDAALVRVVNLHQSDDSPRLDMGRRRFSSLVPGTVGPYRPVPPGIHILGGAGGVEFTPQPGRFYSVVFGPDNALTVLPDTAHTDPARAQLVLYNFTDTAVDLAAEPGDTVILEGVEPDQSRSIAVNANRRIDEVIPVY